MDPRTIVAELAGGVKEYRDQYGNTEVRALLIVEEYPDLPDLIRIRLVGHSASVAAEHLADANGQMLQVSLFPRDDTGTSRPWLAVDLLPVPPRRVDGTGAQGAGTPPAMHAQIVDMYAKPVAEVLAGQRDAKTVTPILHPELKDKFRRLSRPLAHGNPSIRRSFVQAGYPRIEVATAVRIQDRTWPLAVGITVSSGSPEVDTIVSPNLNIRAARPIGQVHVSGVTTSTAGPQVVPGPGQAVQR